ncbi:MAG: hypothetical protein MJE68_07560 [Proteobacteria bacterium]|nr:hypothetical protein [Pseudomonadota bacterium]
MKPMPSKPRPKPASSMPNFFTSLRQGVCASLRQGVCGSVCDSVRDSVVSGVHNLGCKNVP